MAHAHDHHHHAHDHRAHDAQQLGSVRAQPIAPAPSLIQLSVPQRLAAAGVLSALIWAGVWWALHP